MFGITIDRNAQGIKCHRYTRHGYACRNGMIIVIIVYRDKNTLNNRTLENCIHCEIVLCHAVGSIHHLFAKLP